MAARLADRLAVVRGRLFVGRSDELSRFRSALAEAELPFHVLYVFGPGGVGKTALLQERCPRLGRGRPASVVGPVARVVIGRWLLVAGRSSREAVCRRSSVVVRP